MIRRRALLLPLLLVGGLVACSSDDSTSEDATTTAGGGGSTTTEVTPGDSDPVDESTTIESTTEGSTGETTGSGTDGTTGASGSDGGDSEFCEPMDELANYNANTPAPDVTGDWDDLKDELLASAEDALPLYDDAIAVAPDEARDDLETLRDYSDELLGAIQESSSFEDFFAAVGTPPDEVLTAAQDLNAYIAEECGIELTAATTPS
jgi:hypothetical protein